MSTPDQSKDRRAKPSRVPEHNGESTGAVVEGDVLLPDKGPRQRARQQRASETVEVILDATIEVIEHAGEAGVRIADIVATTGVSHGAIYHHFGDRDGLIQAAQFARLARQPGQAIAALREAVESIDDPAVFVDLVTVIAHAIADPDRMALRLVRASVIASSLSRPALHDALCDLETSIADELVEVLGEMQRKGALAEGLDPVAVGMLLEAVSFGLVLTQFTERRPSPEQLADVMAVTFGALIAPEELKPKRDV